MPIPRDIVKQEIHLYIERAREMLDVAVLNLSEGYPDSAVNRAYYAIFYAASALLLTEGLGRSKHSGVIAAFRQRFVKPGIIEIEYSRIYGRVMDDRLASDYEIEISVEAQVAERDLAEARLFVERIERHLQQEDWL
jgi:uncharacterized protein (UPF0332 family)